MPPSLVTTDLISLYLSLGFCFYSTGKWDHIVFFSDWIFPPSIMPWKCHLCCQKWQYILHFCGWVVFHCVYLSVWVCVFMCIHRHGLNSFDYKPLSWLGSWKDGVAIYSDVKIMRGTSWRKCVGTEGLVLVELDNQVSMWTRGLYIYLEARTYMCEPAAQGRFRKPEAVWELLGSECSSYVGTRSCAYPKKLPGIPVWYLMGLEYCPKAARNFRELQKSLQASVLC